MCSVCRKGFRRHRYRAIFSSPCHLACAKLPRNHLDSLMTRDIQFSYCSHRPVSGQPSQSVSSPSRPIVEMTLMTSADPLPTPVETTPITWPTNTPTGSMVSSALPILTLSKTVGCTNCDLCRHSIRKGYLWPVYIICMRDRHLQCTDLCRSEREAIWDGDHSWACYGTNAWPTFMRRNDTEPLQMEVKDADIGNSNEDVAPNLWGHPVPNAPGK